MAGGELGLPVYDPSLIFHKGEHLIHEHCAARANIQPDLRLKGVLSADLYGL